MRRLLRAAYNSLMAWPDDFGRNTRSEVSIHSTASVMSCVRGCMLKHLVSAQNSKGAGVEQRVLQALMAKRFPKIVAQLEMADTSVVVRSLTDMR